jgi:hypothetical protein
MLADVIRRARAFGFACLTLHENLFALGKSKPRNIFVRSNRLAFRYEQAHAKGARFDGANRSANINTLRRWFSIQGNTE